jgi:mRNA interferase MazF
VSYDRFDVVLLLFPFTEKKGRKQRPAIVLSNREFNISHRHSIAAMVTTAGATTWPSDITIRDVGAAGLMSPSVARAKLFTIADELVIGRVGRLTEGDAAAISRWTASLILPEDHQAPA